MGDVIDFVESAFYGMATLALIILLSAFVCVAIKVLFGKDDK